MTYLRLFLLWLSFPFVIFKHDFFPSFKRGEYDDRRLGYGLHITEQRQFAFRFRKRIHKNKTLCFTDMLRWHFLDVIATEKGDPKELRSSLLKLIGIAIAWYAVSDKQHKLYTNQLKRDELDAPKTTGENTSSSDSFTPST